MPTLKGEQNGRWRGGIHDNGIGYPRVSAGPLRGKYVHRIVAEAMIGRPLREDEDVHHIDGDTMNFHPSNLKVMPATEHRPLSPGRPWPKRQAEGNWK